MLTRPRVVVCVHSAFKPVTAEGYTPANEIEESGVNDHLYFDDPAGFSLAALTGTVRLCRRFSMHAENVLMFADDDISSDQVFSADATFSLFNGDHVTVVSNFKNTHRQPEVDRQIAAIKASDAKHDIERRWIYPEEYGSFCFEGTGDAVYDIYRDVVWAGYSTSDDPKEGRSDIRAHRALEKLLDVPFNSIETRNPYYHIDTVLAPLSRGHMLVNVDGLTEDQLEDLKENAFRQYGLDPNAYLIELSSEDGNAFATNLRCFGNHIIMPECSEALQDILRSKGYTVETVNLDPFIKVSMGAGHCLSNNIDERRVIGGYHQHLGLMPEPATQQLSIGVDAADATNHAKPVSAIP